MSEDRIATRTCVAPRCGQPFIPKQAGPVAEHCGRDACRKALQRAGWRAQERQTISLAQVNGYLYGDPDAGKPSSWHAFGGVLEEWAPDLLEEFLDAEEDARLRRALGSPWGPSPSAFDNGAYGDPAEVFGAYVDFDDPGWSAGGYGAGYDFEGDGPDVFDPRRVGVRSHSASLEQLEREARFDVGATHSPDGDGQQLPARLSALERQTFRPDPRRVPPGIRVIGQSDRPAVPIPGRPAPPRVSRAPVERVVTAACPLPPGVCPSCCLEMPLVAVTCPSCPTSVRE